MLRPFVVCLTLCTLGGCQLDSEALEYCAESSTTRISIDFEERLIRVVDVTGNSQVVSRIFPCSDGAIEHCFSGYITMFDPRYAARPGDEDKVEFFDQDAVEGTTIRITGPTSQIWYRARFEGSWPKRFSARFFDEMRDDHFSLC